MLDATDKVSGCFIKFYILTKNWLFFLAKTRLQMLKKIQASLKIESPIAKVCLSSENSIYITVTHLCNLYENFTFLLDEIIFAKLRMFFFDIRDISS